MTDYGKGPTIFHHILQETIFTETVKSATNAAGDIIVETIGKQLKQRTAGLALLEITAMLQALAVAGISNILQERVPSDYGNKDEIARLAAIIIHQRALAPESPWAKIFEWSAQDYHQKYRQHSDIAGRLITASSDNSANNRRHDNG